MAKEPDYFNQMPGDPSWTGGFMPKPTKPTEQAKSPEKEAEAFTPEMEEASAPASLPPAVEEESATKPAIVMILENIPDSKQPEQESRCLRKGSLAVILSTSDPESENPLYRIQGLTDERKATDKFGFAREHQLQIV